MIPWTLRRRPLMAAGTVGPPRGAAPAAPGLVVEPPIRCSTTVPSRVGTAHNGLRV